MSVTGLSSLGFCTGGDLLVSLTSTFDAKLRSLLSSGANDATDTSSSSPLFSDPSLHKAPDKEVNIYWHVL